jgi:hypothetical protein
MPAQAAVQVFFGEKLVNSAGTVDGAPVTARGQFQDQLEGTSVESFEGFTSTPTSLSFVGSAGTIGATLSRDGASLSSSATLGRYATSGRRYLSLSSSGSFLLTFDTAVSAIGFYGTDLGDFDGQLSIELTRGSEKELVTIPHSRNAPNGALAFFGLIDKANPFTAVRFISTRSSAVDNFGIDDITIGDPAQVASVPEPAAWALMMLGFGAIGGALRRRRVTLVACA